MYRKPPKVNYEEKDTSRSITSLYLNNFSGKEKPRNQMTSRKSLTKRQTDIQNKSMEKSLSRWKSNPNLLLTNSYIKLSDVESTTIQNLIENLQKKQLKRSRLSSIKSQESFKGQRKSITTHDQKDYKFLRKKTQIHNDYDHYQKEIKIMNIRQENLEKSLKIKENELEIMKNQISLLNKTIDSKNRKINQHQQLISCLKTENKEKLKYLQKQITALEIKLFNRQKQNQELQEILHKTNKQNENLSKKVQELISTEQSFFKDAPISFNFGENTSDIIFQTTSTGENLCSVNELEDEVHQKNLQIYELKKNIEKFNIKEHYLEAKHEEQMKRTYQENQKKYKDLMQKYKKVENQFKSYKVKMQNEMERRLELNYTQSEINYSFVIDP